MCVHVEYNVINIWVTASTSFTCINVLILYTILYYTILYYTIHMCTSTVLSTSSEDGSLSLYRRDFVGNWRSVQDLPGVNETKQFYNN